MKAAKAIEALEKKAAKAIEASEKKAAKAIEYAMPAGKRVKVCAVSFRTTRMCPPHLTCILLTCLPPRMYVQSSSYDLHAPFSSHDMHPSARTTTDKPIAEAPAIFSTPLETYASELCRQSKARVSDSACVCVFVCVCLCVCA
jgi:hypothetical protein